MSLKLLDMRAPSCVKMQSREEAHRHFGELTASTKIGSQNTVLCLLSIVQYHVTVPKSEPLCCLSMFGRRLY